MTISIAINSIVEFYKRSVKKPSHAELGTEIMIHNYRLRAVEEKDEFTEKERNFMVLNQGTSIYMNNSIIKPEVYKFSTKIKDDIESKFLKDTRKLIKKAKATDDKE